jgi:hypothetical protein
VISYFPEYDIKKKDITLKLKEIEEEELPNIKLILQTIVDADTL